MKVNTQFYEKQRIKLWWIWILFIGINIPFIYGIIQQIFIREPWGNNPMSNTGLIIAALLILILSVLILFSFLETNITKHGIYVRYFPFNIKFKYFDWADIQKVEIRSYKPIRDFGGYGIRYKRNMKASYILGGTNGLLVELKNGTKFMIGTQKPNELKNILTTLGKLS